MKMTFYCLAALSIGLIAGQMASGQQVGCTHDPYDCEEWGAGPSNPYPGYCCSEKFKRVGVCVGVGEVIQEQDPEYAQCGNLRVELYDPQLEMYYCEAIVDPFACGGGRITGPCFTTYCGS